MDKVLAVKEICGIVQKLFSLSVVTRRHLSYGLKFDKQDLQYASMFNISYMVSTVGLRSGRFSMIMVDLTGEEDQGHLPHHEYVQPGCHPEVPHRRVLVSRGGPGRDPGRPLPWDGE